MYRTPVSFAIGSPLAGTAERFIIMIHASCAEHDNEGVADAALAGTLSGSSGWLCRAVSPRVMQLQGAVNTIPVKTCWSLEKARLYI
jgi:hypothetical protein